MSKFHMATAVVILMVGTGAAFAQTRHDYLAPDPAPDTSLSLREVMQLLQVASRGSANDQIAALDTIAASGEQFGKYAMDIRPLLDAPAADVCRAAARALWSMHGSATAAWIDAAESNDGYTRRLALIALADPRQPIEAARQSNAQHVMLAGLASHDPLIASPAAEGLCRFWPGSADALVAKAEKSDAIRKVLVDHLIYDKNAMIGLPTAVDLASGERLTEGAARDQTLTRLGTLVAPDLANALVSPDGRVSEPARKCAVRLMETPLALPIADALQNAIKAKDDELRRRVTEIAGRLGKVGVPALIEGTCSDDMNTRLTSVTGLAERSESLSDPKAMAAMADRIFDPRKSIQRVALKWALRISKPPDDLIDRLVDTLPKRNYSLGFDAELRVMAIQTLGHFAAQPKIAVPALQTALNDEDRDVRLAAIGALQAFGKDARPAIDNLTILTTSEDPQIRASSGAALLSLGDEGRRAAAPYYVKLLNRNMKEHGDLIAAVRRIGELGPEAQPAVQDLIQLLAADDNDLRIEVAHVLGNIGSVGKPAIPALTRMVDNRNEEVRATAVEALTRIAPDGSGLGPALVAAVYNSDRSSADRFAAALRNSRNISLLTRRLTDIGSDDPDMRVRETARRAIQFLQSNVSPESTTQPAA